MLAKTSEVASTAEQSAIAMREATLIAGSLIEVIENTRYEVDGAVQVINDARMHANNSLAANHSLF